MAKLTISHLLPAGDVPALREAIAESQYGGQWQMPNPEILFEHPWDTIPGREQVLVVFNVYSPAQAFVLGAAFAAKKEVRDE
jgi:hypothetical protein